jgi:hypothetical protein
VQEGIAAHMRRFLEPLHERPRDGGFAGGHGAGDDERGGVIRECPL